MEKALECDLKYFSLSEILQLMEKFKKTGKIEISYRDKKGEIFLEEGRCVHSHFSNKEGIDALYEMAQFIEGKLIFIPSLLSDKKTISAPFTVLRDEIEKRSYEIKGLKEKLPDLDTRMVKSDKSPSPELTLRKTDWKILTLMDGKKTLREIIEQSSLGLLESYKSLVYLKEKGLIVDPEESKKARENLTKFLNEWLKELSGEIESEINKQSEFIIETIKKTNPEIGNSISFKKEFKISENINLSFKDIEEIKRKLDEIFLGKLEEIFGKILARKKYETLKKKL
ncbi:MAG: DUF4388 domain-containing protein [candidate division WOR-3 bacterium]